MKTNTKPELAEVIPAVIGEPVGGFVQVAFPPFAMDEADWHPGFADRGKYARRWKRLNKNERRVAFYLSGTQPTRKIARTLKMTVKEVTRYEQAALKKLCIPDRETMRALHCEHGLRSQKRVWAARGKTAPGVPPTAG